MPNIRPLTYLVVEESYYEYEVSFYLNFEFGFFFDFFNFANGH